jgi:hypothetical protein
MRSAKARPASAAPSLASNISTFMPPAAMIWAIPRPMAPVPITPMVKSVLCASLTMDFRYSCFSVSQPEHRSVRFTQKVPLTHFG